jgi:predicted DNA-binding transcriptional regulator YafY
MAVAQTHLPRLLHLVRLLERRGEIGLAEAVREVGASERELLEDARLLSTCGVPPYSPADLFEIEVENGVLRLGRRFLELPRLQLTTEELAGLRLAARLGESEGWGEAEALKRAIAKIEAALTPARREQGRRLARRLGVALEPPAVARHLRLLERAVRERREVEMLYYSEQSEALAARRLRPWRIEALPEARYVVGYDVGRRAERTFRVDRIQRLKLAAARFEPPADAGRSSAGEDRRVAVALRFDPPVARLAAEQFRSARRRAGGSLEVSTRVWPGPGFWRFVLSWAGHCEVVSPASERAAVAAYARRVARAYRLRTRPSV